MARSVRRLPGVQFESRPPPLPEVLPRMDVAVFVGFAASGPLHLPVAVDDLRSFADLFGDDASLAWDAERGEVRCANLGPSVRAFFRNGGGRCWVVRVARPALPEEERGSDGTDANDWARSNRFPVAGLARLSGGVLAPAFLAARCEGSSMNLPRLVSESAKAFVSIAVRTRKFFLPISVTSSATRWRIDFI